jgi:nucleoside 2-deoxyribosyltransferase
LADDALEEIGKYFVAMSFAAEQVGAACKRVDETEFTGDIVQEIKRLISESVAVIVDLSEGRANVLYETGYAHALEKPTVHICSTDFSQLPFDVRNWNTIKYNRGQTTLLKQPLAERLGKVIEK